LVWVSQPEETAHKLEEVSERAQERVRLRDAGYALVTAENAAAAAAKGQGINAFWTVDSVLVKLYSSSN
jgi:hypothetical protein